mmetsp:Transcript_5268/g.8831  ORF Transcript_5268/g.8831 Transcript_5268/m.8831 type:complete len:82 (+) Transcript_5268:192-437(+)
MRRSTKLAKGNTASCKRISLVCFVSEAEKEICENLLMFPSTGKLPKSHINLKWHADTVELTGKVARSLHLKKSEAWTFIEY